VPTLFFSSRQPLAPIGEGGGETIAHDLLHALHARGLMDVDALGAFNFSHLTTLNQILTRAGVCMRLEQVTARIQTCNGGREYPASSHAIYKLSGSYPTALARDDHFMDTWRERISRRPGAVFLQGHGFLECWKELRDSELADRTLLYVLNGAEPDILGRISGETPRLLALSAFVQRKLLERGFESEVLYPAIDIERYRPRGTSPPRARFTILFVNPVGPKGLKTVLHLIDGCPDVEFLILEGWRRIDPALSSALSGQPNVKCLRKTWDMHAMYSSADLVIVPSICDEAFGRVVVEAHAAGVPTLASRIGGLPEASGEAGELVDDFTDPEAWRSAVAEIVRRGTLSTTEKAALELNARRFVPERAASRLATIAGQDEAA
jgi:glycosyltransferase involved in cell wall biosynthesis